MLGTFISLCSLLEWKTFFLKILGLTEMYMLLFWQSCFFWLLRGSSLSFCWGLVCKSTHRNDPYKRYFVSYLCWCCTLSSWVWVLLNLNTCFSFLIIEKFFVFLDKVYWLPCGCIFRNHLAQSSVCNKFKMSMSRELDHIESQKYYLVLHISHTCWKGISTVWVEWILEDYK